MLDRIWTRASRTIDELWDRTPGRDRPSEDPHTVTASIYVDVPPSVVFETVADPEKPFLTSNPITEMSVVGDQTRGAGIVYRWTFGPPFGPVFTFDEVVTEWVEDERFTYRATSGWTMEASTVLTPEHGGTRVTFTLRYRLPRLLSWLLPRQFERLGVNRAVQNIRRYAEAEYRDRALDATTLLEFAVNIDAPPQEVFRVVGDPRSKRV